MSVSDICDRMGCSQALISHHLTDMQAKGILLIRRRGVMLFIVWRVIEVTEGHAVHDECISKSQELYGGTDVISNIN